MVPQAQALLKELLAADYAYYTELKPVMPDATYDRKATEFKSLEPSHPYCSKVGAAVPVNAVKVRHRLVAGSQEKLKNSKEIRDWEAKNPNGENVGQWKLDGFTLVNQYQDGVLVEAASRGDGVIGESVLFNAIFMDSIPKRLPVPFTGDVRGEAILSKAKFKQFFEPLDYANPRNSVGVIRDQKGTGLAKHLDFIAFDFESVNPNDTTLSDFLGHAIETEEDRTTVMSLLGFDPVESIYCGAEALEKLFKQFTLDRDAYDYEVDGVIFRWNSLKAQAAAGMSSDNRPKGQRCVKFENSTVETTCTGVVLTMGSTGAIIPSLSFSPVQLDGITIKSVPGTNYNYLKEDLNDIRIGDTVVIEKAGGVIPHVADVFPRYDHTTGERIGQPFVAPSECPWCGSSTFRDGVHTKCSNQSCEARGVQKVMQWITKRDIKQLGDKLLQELYNSGAVTEPQHLYTNITQDSLANVIVGNGVLGEKRAQMVMEEIKNSMTCSLQDLMGSVCIKFLGRREAEIIMDKTGISTLDEFFSMTTQMLLAVGGYKETKANGIVDGIKIARPVLEALVEAGVTVKKVIPGLPQAMVEAGKPYENSAMMEFSMTPPPGIFSGQTLLFTGKIEKCDETGARYTRKRMQDLAIKQGAKIEDDFKSTVTILVTAELDSPSSKMKKAQKASIKIMGEDEFFSMVM